MQTLGIKDNMDSISQKLIGHLQKQLRLGGRNCNGCRKNLNPFNFLVGVWFGGGLVGVRQGFVSGLVWVC